jgi:hypothetical protein
MTGPAQASDIKHLRLLLGAWQALSRKMNPGRSRVTRRTRAFYWLNGITQSILHRIQNKSHEDALARVVPSAPIFVLGFWRSGTTLLHELLCCDLRFGYPTTYACLNPSHFLISERWVRTLDDRQVRRPMDDLRYSWSSPQEDEFAMLALGAPSAYEALLVPSLMDDVSSLLDLHERSVKDQERWCCTFDYFLKLLTLQQGRTMVLKSPTHGYRMRILQRKFPAARFVIIDRNPYEVFASNLKLWRTLTNRYSLEHCTANQLERFVLAAYVMHQKAISDGVEHAEPRSVEKVRYEDLVGDPIGEVSRLYRILDLGDFARVEARLKTYLEMASGHTRNRFRLSQGQKERVEREWGAIIEQNGYAWPNSYIDLE